MQLGYPLLIVNHSTGAETEYPGSFDYAAGRIGFWLTVIGVLAVSWLASAVGTLVGIPFLTFLAFLAALWLTVQRAQQLKQSRALLLREAHELAATTHAREAQSIG